MEEEGPCEDGCDQRRLSRMINRVVHNTIRRYDLLVRKHAEMYLKKENDRDKLSLSSAFVKCTLDDAVSVLIDPRFRRSLAECVKQTTERVVSKCNDEKLIAPEALTRVHFPYLYCLYSFPARLINNLRESETIWYRDVASAYERYVALKVMFTNILENISTVLFSLLFPTANTE